MKILLPILLFKCIFSQEIIGEGLSGQPLINYLESNYKTSSTLGYDHARDTLYLRIERDNGEIKGVYSNYTTSLPDGIDPSGY